MTEHNTTGISNQLTFHSCTHHCHCQHDNLSYCKKCGVVYCKDCGKEWVEKICWTINTDDYCYPYMYTTCGHIY